MIPKVHPRAKLTRPTLRYCAWSWTFGLACWLATHGPRRRRVEVIDGYEHRDVWLLPVARRVMRFSYRFWRDEFSPDW